MTAPKIDPLAAVAGTANQAGLVWSRRQLDHLCDCTDGSHEAVIQARPTGPLRYHLLTRTELTVVGPWEEV